LATMFAYTGELLNNVAGGARRGSVFAGAGAAQLTVRLRPLLGWNGARLFVFFLGTNGGAPSGLVGDVQGLSNLEAPPGIRLEEAWLQQNMLGNRVSLLAGRYDLSSEFYFTGSGNLFVNSSLGTGANFGLSGVEGPSIYPFTSVGARVEAKPSPNTVVRMAALDGVPVDRPDGGIHLFAPGDGALIVGEFALLSRPDTAAVPRSRRFQIGRGLSRPYSGKVALGGWYYTAHFPDLVDTLITGAPLQHRGSVGGYIIADQTIWRAPHGGPALVTMFAQLGVSDPRVNQVGGYVGGGLTMAAPFAKRTHDELGVAIAAARNGSHFTDVQSAAGISAASETALELTYLAQFAGWIAVQPDLQYIINPGGTRTHRDAVAIGLRIAVSYQSPN
jgi:porin